MELSFETRQLREICEKKEDAEAYLGKESAGDLRHRLADFIAAKVATDVQVGNPTYVNNKDGSFLIVYLTDGTPVVLVSNHIRTPKLESGIVDWRKVTRVRIIRIGGLNG